MTAIRFDVMEISTRTVRTVFGGEIPAKKCYRVVRRDDGAVMETWPDLDLAEDSAARLNDAFGQLTLEDVLAEVARND